MLFSIYISSIINLAENILKIPKSRLRTDYFNDYTLVNLLL